MFQLSQTDIHQGYRGVRNLAASAMKKKDYERTLSYIYHCSIIAGQFNWIYSDAKIEDMLHIIAEDTINKSEKGFNPDSNRWVLYDDWCTSYVLAIQWLEAMSKSGKEILYIASRDFSKPNRNASILDRAEAFSNVSIHIVPQGSEIERAQNIYNTIVEFKASKLVLHKGAVSSPVNLALYVLPSGIRKYLINLSDQTFWLGSKAIDYCLEFRQFGASVSLQKRGLRKDQLLLVPFYPADDRNAFSGFPGECTKDKIIIFSGGDYYKTLNEKRTYWKLVKAILDRYPQVVFLFATKNIPEGDAEIYQFIKDNSFEGRFFYIQFRPDIYQVFAHCDIYMGTSPTSGSLMSGLACVNAKPILQYYEPETTDDETEQSVCYNEHYSISFSDENAFLQEADKLINDVQYRKKQGERLQRAIISVEQFDNMVKNTLESNRTQLPIIEYQVDYEELFNRWYYLEKAGYTQYLPYIYSLLKKKHCLIYAPGVFIKKNLNRFIAK